MTLAISVLTGILFGLVPGLRAARQELNITLSGAAKGTLRRGPRDSRLPAGRVLVAGQIAVSLAVLIVAGLFLRSFQGLTSQDPGFDHDHLLQFDVGFLEASGYSGPAVHANQRSDTRVYGTVCRRRHRKLHLSGWFQTQNGNGELRPERSRAGTSLRCHWTAGPFG